MQNVIFYIKYFITIYPKKVIMEMRFYPIIFLKDSIRYMFYKVFLSFYPKMVRHGELEMGFHGPLVLRLYTPGVKYARWA